MSSGEVARLWKVAQIDRQALEIRKRAASLDVGQREQEALKALGREEAEIGGNARRLQQEIIDFEISQKSDEDKRKRIEKEIFGGKVVNPKEVENLQKESEMIKRKRDKDAEKLLELYDLAPPAVKEWDEIKAKIDAANKAIAQKRAKATETKKQLEESFEQLSAKRPEAGRGVSANLLARYETIRKGHGGIGMVEVDSKTGSCGGCGTHLPERTIQMLKEDKVVICEACHRLLYYTEGVV